MKYLALILVVMACSAQADVLNQCIYAADAGKVAAAHRDDGVSEEDSVELLKASHPNLEEGAIVELVEEVNETTWTAEQISREIFGQCMVFDTTQH